MTTAGVASGLPERRQARSPPASEATMPETTHHRPAPGDRLAAVGVSLPAGSRVDKPMPRPIMLRIICATRAATAPAKIAPQET